MKGSACQFGSFIHRNSILCSAARVIFLKGKSDGVVSLLHNVLRLPCALRHSWESYTSLQGPASLIYPTSCHSPLAHHTNLHPIVKAEPVRCQASIIALFLSCQPSHPSTTTTSFPHLGWSSNIQGCPVLYPSCLIPWFHCLHETCPSLKWFSLSIFLFIFCLLSLNVNFRSAGAFPVSSIAVVLSPRTERGTHKRCWLSSADCI